MYVYGCTKHYIKKKYSWRISIMKIYKCRYDWKVKNTNSLKAAFESSGYANVQRSM